MLVIDSFRSSLAGKRIERRANIIESRDFIDLEITNEHAAIGANFQDTAACQETQSLPDGRPAYSQQIGQFAFVDPLPWLNLAGQNHPFQLPEDDSHQGSILKVLYFTDIEFVHFFIVNQRVHIFRSLSTDYDFQHGVSSIKSPLTGTAVSLLLSLHSGISERSFPSPGVSHVTRYKNTVAVVLPVCDTTTGVGSCVGPFAAHRGPGGGTSRGTQYTGRGSHRSDHPGY